MKTESVWDYPRPPRLETTARRIRVVQGGVKIVDTTAAMRVLETSHPPVYYVPPTSVAAGTLRASASRGSFCEFKGIASYWDLLTARGVIRDVAWSYGDPSRGFEALAGYLAFYASRVDECWVDDELVIPQEGDFYGGWITKDIVGPFKGGAGTWGW
jgi:uncharacterized protein (DUF427 family)